MRWRGSFTRHDMTVKDEIERLAREYGRLGEEWVLNPKSKTR